MLIDVKAITSKLLFLSLFFIGNLASGQQALKTLRTIGEMAAVGETIFFVADNGRGEMLWTTNGTPENTRQIQDNPYAYERPSEIKNLISFNQQLFFSARSEKYGCELWRSNGTTQGTAMLVDLEPSNTFYPGSFPEDLTVFNNHLYFTTQQGDLYKSDGTAEGTVLIDHRDYARISLFTVAGNYIYYSKGDNEIVRTDGTTFNTIPLPSDPFTNEESHNRKLYSAGGKLFALRASGYYTTIRLYSLAENNSWTLVKEFSSDTGGQSIEDFTEVGNKLFFDLHTEYEGNGATDELWVTDGTPEGTLLLKAAATADGAGNPIMDSFVDYYGVLLFRGINTAQKALWKSDGTVQGTMKVYDVVISDNPDDIPSRPLVANGLFWFCGDQDQFGNYSEPWYSDGTPGGTKMFSDLNPENRSRPYRFTSGGEMVYFLTGSYNSTGSTTLWNNLDAPILSVRNSFDMNIPNGGILGFSDTQVDNCERHTIKITNAGHNELAISRVQIIGDDFYMTGDLPEFLEVGKTIFIQIYYNPILERDGEATLSLYTNDSYQPTFSLNLRGATLPSPKRGFCQEYSDAFVKTIRPSNSKRIQLNNNTVAQGTPEGSAVGVLSIPDFSGAVTYSLTPGVGEQDNGRFFIEGNVLKTRITFDDDIKNLYAIRVRAITEQSTYEDFFTIHVNRSAAPVAPDKCKPGAESFFYSYMDLEFNSEGHLFAITNDGKILRSMDEGITWKILNSGINSGVTFSKIHFRNSTGYITGQDILLKSEDNGETWFQIYVPFTSYNASINLFLLDDGSGFLCGSGGELFYTPDGGKTWELRISDPSPAIQKVWFWDKTNGLAIKGDNGIASTSDGGKSWNNINANFGFSISFTGLWFLNKTDGFLTTTDKIFMTTDGGKKWAKVRDIYSGNISGIEFTPNGFGYVYGGQNGTTIYKTQNSGITWVELFNMGPGLITGIAYPSNGHKLFTAHIPVNGGRALNFSEDGGDHWQGMQELQGDTFLRVEFLSENDGTVYGTRSKQKTTDHGLTWHRVEWDRPIYSTHFFDDDNGLLSDGIMIYRTSDGGATMTEVFGDYDNNLPVGKLFAVNDNLIFSFSGYALYVSMDKGENWQLVNSEPGFNTQALHFITPSIGYRLDVFGKVQKTNDSGVNWQQVSTDSQDDITFNSVFFVNESVGYKAGKTFRKSIDGGITWTTVDTKFYGNEIIGLNFTDPMHGYATSKYSLLYETFDGGLTWAEISLGPTDGIRSSQQKFGNIYFCGDSGFLGQISNAPKKATQAGYIFGSNVVCSGSALKYKLPENYTVNYQWAVNGAILEADRSVAIVEFPTPGEYTISVNLYNNCGSGDVRTFNVVAYKLENPIIEGLEIIASDSRNVAYTVSNPQPDVYYSWGADGGLVGQNTQEAFVNWDMYAENANVNVIAKDVVSGCRARGDLDVVIDMTVGVGYGETDSFSIYPNPTNEKVRIESGVTNNVQMRIFDLIGNELLTQEFNGGAQVDLSRLPSGIYVFEIRDHSTGRRKSKKVIKR